MYSVLIIIIAIIGTIYFDMSVFFTQRLLTKKWFIPTICLHSTSVALAACWVLKELKNNPIIAALIAGIGVSLLLIGFRFIYKSIISHRNNLTPSEIVNLYTTLVEQLEPSALIREIEKLPEISNEERKELERYMKRAMHLDEMDQKIALASLIVEHGGKKYVETLVR